MRGNREALVSQTLGPFIEESTSLFKLNVLRQAVQLSLAPLKVKSANGAQRLLAGAIELVLPEGNVVLKLGDFFFRVHHGYNLKEKAGCVKFFVKFLY